MSNETDDNGAYYADSIFASSEEDDELSSVNNSSEDDDEQEDDSVVVGYSLPRTEATTAIATTRQNKQRQQQQQQQLINKQIGATNLLHTLLGRERTDVCSRQLAKQAFCKVPNHLRFCLDDVIPYWSRHSHIFMGLTACGQFMLSYSVHCNDNMSASRYNLGIVYHYKLHFWWFKPHAPLAKYFSCVLFDDHGVDSIKNVTMTQWKYHNNSRIIIVHGTGEDETETSYLTYAKVPKLGCLHCKQLQQHTALDDVIFNLPVMCLGCSLTVHTKYSIVETDRAFNPHINLLCPERMLIMANGFVHMLRIDLENAGYAEMHAMQQTTLAACQPTVAEKTNNATTQRTIETASQTSQTAGDIVARIIADFSDIETPEHMSLSKDVESTNAVTTTTSAIDELVLKCGSSKKTDNNSNGISATVIKSKTTASRVSLIRYAGRRQERIITKSFRNGITTVDLQSRVVAASATATSNNASNAYEFSEDNEKCEKISTLRKRRLADKKYEFSEDNSENIIPFTKTRLEQRSTATRSLPRAVFQSSPCASPSSSPHAATQTQQGFRSPPPCSSSSIMRSPSRQLYCYNAMSKPPSPAPTTALTNASQSMPLFKPLGALSPLQVAMTKRNFFDKSGSMSPNTNVPFLSPRREDLPRMMEVPLQVMPALNTCTKKFKRRYVDQDDAASVITSEEDDCTSPGYYTSLPVEVHGCGYSEMQMISQTSYQRLCCASVVITQHSFDLEAFTHCVIAALCQKNHKIHEVLYDWNCEAITVCPLSNTIIFLLMAEFSAKELGCLPATTCINCLYEFDCAVHMGPYECRILFSWNMETGESDVLDYGELMKTKPFQHISPLKYNKNVNTMTLAQKAKTLAKDMASTLSPSMQMYASNLRVLDSNIKKSKTSLIDEDNMIEFYLKRPRNSE